MFLLLIKSPIFSFVDRIIDENSVGEFITTSAPKSLKRLITSGERIAFENSSCIFWVICTGVLAGKNKPAQV